MAVVEQARDNIAEYVRVLLHADAFWFTIDSSHGHGFSLCSRFGMSARDYEALLLAANLAKHSEKFGFRAKPKEWESFLTGYRFTGRSNGKLQTASKRIDLPAHIDGTQPNKKERVSFYVIQIGQLSADQSKPSPKNFENQKNAAGKQILVPPLLKQIRQYQRTLGRKAARIILDTIIDNDYLYKMTSSKVLNRSAAPMAKSKLNPTVSPTQPTREKSIVSPSRSHTEQSPAKRLRTNPTSDQTTSPIHAIPEQTATPVQARTVAQQKYPSLFKALGGSLDPEDPEAHKMIDSLLSEITELRVEDFELSFKDKRQQEVSYVKVPKPGSSNAWTNTKGFLDKVLEINGTKNSDTYDNAVDVVNHLWRFHEDSTMEGTRRRGIPICTPMSETGFVSMLQEGNLNGQQQKVVTKHLRKHLGKNFLPTREQINMLCDGHTSITTNTIQHKYNLDSEEETVEYCEKDVALELSTQLARHLQSRMVDPKTVKRVTTVWGGDHGGDAFQFGANVKVHFNDGTDPFDFEISACEVICRTDSAELLEKTVVDGLTVGLEKISNSKLFIYRDEDNRLKCCYDEMPHGVTEDNAKCMNKLFMYVTGDLAFYAMALGRESMSGHWCFLCKMCRTMFDKLEHRDTMWTMEELLKIADEVNGGKAKFGVKKRPWWPFIPLENYMIPLLHVLIGLGNDLLDSFLDWVNEELECLDQQEIMTKRAMLTAEHKILDTTAERDVWNGTLDGKRLKSLLQKKRYRVNKLREMGAIVTLAQEANQSGADSPFNASEMLQDFEAFVQEDGVAEEDAEDGLMSITIDASVDQEARGRIELCYQEVMAVEEELAPLKEIKKVITDKLRKTRAFLAEMKKALKGFRSARKKSSESLESKLMKVLKTIGVQLTRYHGGSLNGKDIKKVMDHSFYVFDEFATILKAGCRNDSLTPEKIDQKCEEYKAAFLLWDGAFAMARKVDPSVEDRAMYRRYVKGAIDAHGVIGCSITHKAHLMWLHVHWQMKCVEGGLGDKMEDWVELAHQTGARRRKRFRSVQDPAVRAAARSRYDFRDTDPDVLAWTDALNEESKRKFIDPSRILKKQIKKEERIVKRTTALEAYEQKMGWDAYVMDIDPSPVGMEVCHEVGLV